MTTQIRLNKYLAERLGISRREADNLIASGKILVNQKVAKLGDRVNLLAPEDTLEPDSSDLAPRLESSPNAALKTSSESTKTIERREDESKIRASARRQDSLVCVKNNSTSTDTTKDRNLSERAKKDLDKSDEVCYNGDIGALANMRRAHAFQVQKNGRIVISPEVERIYLALNKPAGYVCSRKSQGENPTIYELLPKKYQELKTVGRLDKDSSGLILLTNDGDFAFRMTHPRFAKVKIYEVELDHALEPLHQQMIADFGIEISDGASKLGLERLDESRKRWRVTMSEGRNRQIRRTFGALGYTVVALHRTDFGPYRLDGLDLGEFTGIKNART